MLADLKGWCSGQKLYCVHKSVFLEDTRWCLIDRIGYFGSDELATFVAVQRCFIIDFKPRPTWQSRFKRCLLCRCRCRCSFMISILNLRCLFFRYQFILDKKGNLLVRNGKIVSCPSPNFPNNKKGPPVSVWNICLCGISVCIHGISSQ